MSGERSPAGAAPCVSVFGANDPAEGDDAYQTARAIGAELARLGYAVATGGYGGTMEACSRGASEAGGRAIGITCTVWSSAPNRYLAEVVETDSLAARIEQLVQRGTGGFVVLPGATGTLLELATVWEGMCKRLLARRPIVCVGDFWRPVVDRMASARASSADAIAFVDGAGGLADHFPVRP